MNLTMTWGGGEKWHLDHALAFREKGHEVYILAQEKGVFLQEAKAKGLTCYPVSATNLAYLNPFKVYLIWQLFKNHPIDVLIMNFSKDLKLAAPIARLVGIRSIVYRRGSAIPIKNTLLNRFLFSNCLTHVLTNSEATKRTILQNNPTLFPADKIEVIYNGITIHEPVFTKQTRLYPVIGNLGRLVFQKGQDILIDVAEIVKNKDIPFQLLIGGDGPLRTELESLVQQKELKDRVVFRGHVTDPVAFMHEIDVFVLPSRWEGFGYVLAEAMMAKKPIVAFDISSNPELVVHGKNGYLIPWGDTTGFANAIIRLIEQPELRREMGEYGYQFAREQFDFEKNKWRVLDFLTQTVKTPC